MLMYAPKTRSGTIGSPGRSPQRSPAKSVGSGRSRISEGDEDEYYSDYSEDDKPTILGEAEVKMAEVKKRYWFPLAAELRGEDHFRFLRAYTGG